ALELAKSTKHPFKKVELWPTLPMIRLVDPDQALHRHVPDEDTSNAKWHSQDRGDLGDRTPVTAVSKNGLAFRAQYRKIAGFIVRCRHHSLDLQVITGFCPASGNRIGTDQRAALIWKAIGNIVHAEIVRRLGAVVAPARRPWPVAVHYWSAT